jgi:hypothetical protein
VGTSTGERDVSLQPTPAIESTTYFFTSRELARLSVYREAVLAHFYTDQCEPLDISNAAGAAELLDSVRQDIPRAA